MQVMFSGRTDIECPACGSKEVFFMTCPSKCIKCNLTFPDVTEIRDSLVKRKKWHFAKDGEYII